MSHDTEPELTPAGMLVTRVIQQSVRAIESGKVTRDIFATRPILNATPSDEPEDDVQIDRRVAEAVVTRQVLGILKASTEGASERRDTIVDRRFDATTLQSETLVDNREIWETRRFVGALKPLGADQESVPTEFDAAYSLLATLSSGSQGKTYLARRRSNWDYAVVKELRVGQLDSWKSLEQFERQIAVLRQLEHESIPAFLDAFILEEEDGPRMLLAQDFVAGPTAASDLMMYGPWSTDRIMSLAWCLLDVLGYLHTQNPPVLHRDVKPENIVCPSLDSFALVDFGVAALWRDHDDAATVVGTAGYGAPEQFMGRSVPASDLYGLGATLVHLATGVPPYKLNTERQRLKWKHLIVGTYPPGLVTFIDRLIAPMPEDRYLTAQAARSALGDLVNSKPKQSGQAQLAHELSVRSSPTEVQVVERDGALTIDVPARWSVRRVQASGTMFVLGVFVLLYLATGPVGGTAAALLLIGAIFFGATAHTGARLVIGPGGWTFEERLWTVPLRSTGYAIKGTARVDAGLLSDGMRLRFHTDGENLEIDTALSMDEVERIELGVETFLADRNKK